MELKKLSSLKAGDFGRIQDIGTATAIRRRLLDMGLIENTRLQCLHISPYGSPLAFSVRGAVIALRKEDCDNIIISTYNN